MTSLTHYSPLRMPTRPAPSVRGRYRLASRSIYNSARPQARTMSEPRRYLNAVLMLALGRCAKDVFGDFCNLDNIKGKFMAEKAELRGLFDQQCKVLFRGVPQAEREAFENVVFDVTDMCEQRTKWLVATVRDELTNKIQYDAVYPGALLGITHGLFQCCNRLNQIMTGRKTSIYTQMMDELLLIDGSIRQDWLNEGVTADWDRITEAIVTLCRDMQEATMDTLGLKREGGDQ